VDRSLIAADAQEVRATIILEAIIAMGHALGLGIVAEGIEDQDQVNRLGELGCDFGQGYFIGRPMTARQVNEALNGLPYAASAGRTAITWLWERALKDPPPTPVVRKVTAGEIEDERAKTEPPPPPAAARPAPVASRKTEPPPEEPAPDEPADAEAADPLNEADESEPGGFEEESPPEDDLAPPGDEDAQQDEAEVQDTEPRMSSAARRRRRKKRRRIEKA
jgi:hypothetical protein